MGPGRGLRGGNPLLSLRLGLDEVVEVGDTEGVGVGIVVAHGDGPRSQRRGTTPAGTAAADTLEAVDASVDVRSPGYGRHDAGVRCA